MRVWCAILARKVVTCLMLVALMVGAVADGTSERPVIDDSREASLTPLEPRVLVSYLDDERLPYASQVELIDVQAFERCLQDNLAACERGGRAGVYPLPLHRDHDADRAKTDIDQAWDTFFDATVRRVHAKINGFPPPWNPLAPCGSHIHWPEVFRRQLDGIVEALTHDQPFYWQDVVTALVTHVPLSLWWEGPFPLQQGAVLTAITTLEPNPGQISRLFHEPRDPSYHLQPFTAGTLLPYAASELALPRYPGLEAKEIAKGGNVFGQGLEPATPSEQSQFGFASFLLVWGDFEDTWFTSMWGSLPVPSIVGSVCLIPYPPFFAIIPFIPVPTFVPQVPRAVYGQVSVPEGYAVPRLQGSPQWALPPLRLPPVPRTLPPQALPGADELPESVPCLPHGAQWPPPGYDEDALGHAPELYCPEGTPILPIYQEPVGD